MDFAIPDEIQRYLAELDDFIEREIKPLEREHIQYFDHRREWARTDFDNDGQPRPEWEQLLGEMRRRADRAGPPALRAARRSSAGATAANLAMAIIREHLAAKGLGLHNDLQNEASIVGNFPQVLMFWHFGNARAEEGVRRGHDHRQEAGGVRAHRAEPRQRRALPRDDRRSRSGSEWVINGAKRFNTGLHTATHDLIFARTERQARQPARHHLLRGARRFARLQGRVHVVDLQHADRPRRGVAHERARATTR